MYLTEILSEWILSQLIFLQWTLVLLILSQSNLLQLENAIFGSAPVIIAVLVGGAGTFLGSYYLWLQQQKKELKTLANVFIIDLERIYNSNYDTYQNYIINVDVIMKSKGIFQLMPSKPLYDRNGAYFLFTQKIYMFDYYLTYKILTFYENLLRAESSRKFVEELTKNPDDCKKLIDDPVVMMYVNNSYLEMVSDIISIEEQILGLRQQLKRTLEE